MDLWQVILGMVTAGGIYLLCLRAIIKNKREGEKEDERL